MFYHQCKPKPIQILTGWHQKGVLQQVLWFTLHSTRFYALASFHAGKVGDHTHNHNKEASDVSRDQIPAKKEGPSSTHKRPLARLLARPHLMRLMRLVSSRKARVGLSSGLIILLCLVLLRSGVVPYLIDTQHRHRPSLLFFSHPSRILKTGEPWPDSCACLANPLCRPLAPSHCLLGSPP